MELAEAVRRRRMVRNYTDEPVSSEALERVLQTARKAPSAGFSQGQSLVVVADAATRARIAELCGEAEYVAMGLDPWISRAPVHVVVCTSTRAYLDRYREPDKGGPDSPLGVAGNWPVPYWWVDAGATMMLILLAAVDEGLAAGFLGSHAVPDLKELLGIPDDVSPIGIVTIGHPAPDRRSGSLARGWRPAADVVHRERWGTG
jgi:nitroreductase